ncbi:MAG TPA: CopG family transcriptional regulator [Chloroflexota bacterium]|jgi:hypothetical protein
MKRTTISLPDEIASRLAREARRRSISMSEVAREVLSAHFNLERGESRPLLLESLGRSGYRNTARHIEEILAAESDPSRDR